MDYPINLGVIKMPPGYRLVWSDLTEMYHWQCNGGEIESVIFARKWSAYRAAWAHYKGKNNEIQIAC